MIIYSTTIRLFWVISKAKLLELQPDECLSTKELKCGIPNHQYRLELYPNGHNDIDDGVWIYMCIYNLKKDDSSKVVFTVKIKSASICETVSLKTYSQNESWGRNIAKKIDFFDEDKKFFENEKLTIEFEAKVTYEEPPNPVVFKDNVAKFLWESNDKDFVLNVEDKELRVHKLLLKAYSDVFRAMLTSNMKEAQENRCPIVDFSYECVDLVIKLLYMQIGLDEINENTISEVLHFVDKYHIEYLQTIIENFLIPKISRDNVVKLANIAVTSNASQLQEYCVCYLYSAIGNQSSIKNIEDLNGKIGLEVATRSLSPYLEAL